MGFAVVHGGKIEKRTGRRQGHDLVKVDRRELVRGEGRLVLIRLLSPPNRERWWLHGLLFAITFCTVWMGGTLLAGSSLPFAFPFGIDYAQSPSHLSELISELLVVRPGLDFAMALMALTSLSWTT